MCGRTGYETPATRSPASPAPAISALAYARGGVLDETSVAIAEALPREKSVWIQAWNAWMIGRAPPADVQVVVARFGEAPVRAALSVLLDAA